MHYKLKHTRKSRKGTNSSYRVVFVFTMKSRHVWKAIVQRVKIGQKLREFRFVFCLTFSLSSRHSLYIFGFLYCCIKAKTKLDAEVTKAGLLEQTTYRPMLGNQKGVGFWTPRCGFRSVCQWNFDSWFQSLVGSGEGGGGRYSRNFWVGVCRWDPGTLSLYQSYSSSAEFCYPILD